MLVWLQASKLGNALPSATESLIERQRRAIANQGHAHRQVNFAVEPSSRTARRLTKPPRRQTNISRARAYSVTSEHAHASAYAALLVGKSLPLTQIVGAEVYNYSEVRLRLLLAPSWLPTAGQEACEIILQAHSSAAMLVWLELRLVRITL